MKKSDIQRVARISLVMAFCALLFFIVVLVFTKKFDDKFISGEFNHLTPAPSAAPQTARELVLELVFVTAEDGSLSALYLTELDCLNVKWRLNVIPQDTKLNLSVDLYKQILKDNITAPQITTVDELYKCFEAQTAVKYTKAAIEETLPVKIDYTLTIPAASLRSIFKSEPEKYSYAYFLRDDLEKVILSTGGMQRFMTTLLENCESSLRLKDRLYYLETFEDLTNLDVESRLIPGVRHNSGYEIKTASDDFYRK